MRQTIELLRKQSIQAGLTSAHMQSMGVQVNVNGTSKINGSPTKSNGHEQEHQQPQQQQQNGNMQRQHSTDSVCSVNSNGSNGSSSHDKNKKKKGWVSAFYSKFIRKHFIIKTLFQHSSEVPSRKLFHAMPKSPKQIAKQTFYPQIIPTRNHLYLPHRKSILRPSRESHHSRPPNRVHIATFQLSKMPNPLTQ